MTVPNPDAARPEAAVGSRLSFDEHLSQAMGGLRSALVDLLASVEADPTTPQKISRRFQVNRNLAWKISRLIGEQDQRAAVRHVPGTQGMRILCERFREAGAPGDIVRAVGDAMEGFLHMVEVQAGDRTALDLTLRSLRPEGEGPEGVLAARKLAFQGNSAVWGVRARARLGLQVVVPSSSEGEVDLAVVGGLYDFWRLRSDVRWPLMHHRFVSDEPTPEQHAVEPIDASSHEPGEPPWLREFCSMPRAACRRLPQVPGELYEIAEGPVGNTASLSCVFGQVVRHAAPFFAPEPGQTGEYQLHLNTPVEACQFDVLVHESLPLEAPPEVVLESRMQVCDTARPLGRPLYALDLQEELRELAPGLPDLASTDIPRMPELVESVLARLGRPRSEFRGYRLEVRFPPIPTVLKLIHPLPVA